MDRSVIELETQTRGAVVRGGHSLGKCPKCGREMHSAGRRSVSMCPKVRGRLHNTGRRKAREEANATVVVEETRDVGMMQGDGKC